MSHRALVVLALGGAFAAVPACSARSLVLGGDPLAGEEQGGTAGVAPIGGASSDPGGMSSGGSAIGGSSVGGSVPIGGNPPGGESSGGTAVLGGATNGGTGIGGSAGRGGEGGAFDPYPPVAWEDGQGYRTACPAYPDGWGFTCWNVTDGSTGSCKLSGSPYCNACSCAVPCETSRDCPSSIEGDPALCLSSATTAKSCFIVCDTSPCPNGMTCSQYPSGSNQVCVWVTDPPPPPF